MHLFVGDCDRVLSGKWCSAAKHFVNDNAKRVEVAARVRLPTLCLFGREVARGSHDRTGLCEVLFDGGIHGAGDAEVRDLYGAGRPDENVGGLDIAMSKASFVGEAESSGDFRGDLCSLGRVELTAIAANVGKRATLDVFHGDEVRRFETTPVIDVDDVGVGEAGSRLGFASEAFNKFRVNCEFGEEHLHGDVTGEQLVARQKHVGHTSSTDASLYAVTVVDDRGVVAVFTHVYAALCRR